jgi:hypothetical protein
VKDLTPTEPTASADQRAVQLLLGAATLSTTLMMPATEPKFPRFVGE